MPSILIPLRFNGNSVRQCGRNFIFRAYWKRRRGTAPLKIRYPVDYFIRGFLYDKTFPIKKYKKSIRYYLNFLDKVTIEILFLA